MNKFANRIIAGTAILALGAGCASGGPGVRTAVGAGGGAAVGAGIGGLVGGWKGAAIGAGVGALAGGSVGLYLDMQAQELEKVAETKRTENGVIVKMKNDILFDTNSAVLKPEAIDQLTKVGDILAKYSDDRVKIEGYTDDTGGSAYNEELSRRRAQSVKDIFLSRGVQEKQMLVLGMGETKPIADNKTPAGRAANRRVELHIDVPQPTNDKPAANQTTPAKS